MTISRAIASSRNQAQLAGSCLSTLRRPSRLQQEAVLPQALSPRRSQSTAVAALKPTMSLYRFKHPFDAFLSGHPLIGPLDSHVDASETGGRHRSLWQPDKWLDAPRVDVHELDSSFELSAELPGFKKEDVNLHVDEKTRKITISGESHSEYDSRQHQDTKHDGKDGQAAQSPAPPAKDGQAPAKKAKAIVTERTYGYCSRSFVLPESADVNNVKAKFDNGVLKVIVPKIVKTKSEPRRVTIEDGGNV